MKLSDLLTRATALGASDLHVRSGSPPLVRLHNELTPLETQAIAHDEVKDMARDLLSSEQWEILMDRGEVDAAKSYQGIGCFRFNVYLQRQEIAIACRIIYPGIPHLDDLGLPEAAASLARLPGGLVLVTGPAGSGKTTTLAALIDLINEERACHIITLEDPIEYIHENKRSLITQREIGRDAASFPRALRAALRQDPDIIMIGEMRDLETISIAVTSAETGHLVFATLHTPNAVQSVERIVDVFDAGQQRQMQIQVANCLAGVISQRLLPRADGRGRVLAAEILVVTPAVRNMIREGKTHQIYSSMQTGARYGMQTMETSLQSLLRNGFIRTDAARYAGLDSNNERGKENRVAALPLLARDDT